MRDRGTNTTLLQNFPFTTRTNFFLFHSFFVFLLLLLLNHQLFQFDFDLRFFEFQSMESAVAAPPSTVLSLEGLDDVEDYVWAFQGNMAGEGHTYISELMQKGNKSYREGHFEEAIGSYSRALNITPGEPVVLSNRCAAHMRQCQFLRLRPPSASEYRPLNGLDPTIHAELALKDAEKVVSLLSNSVKSYILKANALILLERYEMARDAILSGLQIDPLSTVLQNFLQNLQRMEANVHRRRNHVTPELNDDFECTVCLKLFFEPVTTPCGHSFCRSCLFQSADRGNKCPLCRTVLFISARTCALSVTLNNIIEKNFPEEYAERKLEHEGLTNPVDWIPLFVMDVVIPSQKFPLHIFEPRYRLMVRRIMEGNHRMGMVGIDSTTNSIAKFACEVEITECEPLTDGRFYLQVESRRRFQILREKEQDGYRLAEVEWIEDIHPPEGTRERTDLYEMTKNTAEYARSWIKRAKEAARRDRRRLDNLLTIESMMPSPQELERFSFWLATLRDLRPQERLNLLQIRDVRERIKLALIYLKAA